MEIFLQKTENNENEKQNIFLLIRFYSTPSAIISAKPKKSLLVEMRLIFCYLTKHIFKEAALEGKLIKK